MILMFFLFLFFYLAFFVFFLDAGSWGVCGGEREGGGGRVGEGRWGFVDQFLFKRGTVGLKSLTL